MLTARGLNVLLRLSIVAAVIAVAVGGMAFLRVMDEGETSQGSATPQLIEAHGVESTPLYASRDPELSSERLYLRHLTLSARARLMRTVERAAARTRLIAANPFTISALRSCDHESTTELANGLLADSTEIDLLALFNAQGALCGFSARTASGAEYQAERVQALFEHDFRGRTVIQACLSAERGREQSEYQAHCDFSGVLLDDRHRALAHSAPVRDPATGAILGAATVRVWLTRAHEVTNDSRTTELAIVTEDGRRLSGAASSTDSVVATTVRDIPPEAVVEMIEALRTVGARDGTFLWRGLLVELANASEQHAVKGGGAYILAYSDLAWINLGVRQRHTIEAVAALSAALLIIACIAIVFAFRTHRLSSVVEANRLAAESSSTAKSDFLTHMSHEIRTPMMSVLGYLELLSRDESKQAGSAATDPASRPATRAANAELIEIASRNARFLLGIIDDLLDLSRVESKKFVPHYEWVSPKEIMDGCVTALLPAAGAKGLVLRIDDSVTEPPEICTDGARLRQIVMNLVNNAVKFTTNGEIVLTARTVGVNELEIRVQDSGRGIADADRDLLFKPFSQIDARANRTHTGTGLGLVICKRYLEALGGTIVLDSVIRVGTTAIVRLPSRPQLLAAIPAPQRAKRHSTAQSFPLRGSAGNAVARASSGEEEVATNALAGVRILVVEDHDANQDLILYFLECAGAVVTVAADGEAAIVRINQADPAFDVVLMDMQMPILDGYGATTKLRESGYTGVIIAMTAHAMIGEREKCLAAGCTEYISKPMTLAQLVNKVKANMPRQRHLA